MNEISHFKDEDGNVVIDATIDNNTYRGILTPRVIDGRSFFKKSQINTDRLDRSKDIQDKIVSYVSTHRGRNKENPLVIENDRLDD